MEIQIHGLYYGSKSQTLSTEASIKQSYTRAPFLHEDFRKHLESKDINRPSPTIPGQFHFKSSHTVTVHWSHPDRDPIQKGMDGGHMPNLGEKVEGYFLLGLFPSIQLSYR